MRLKLIMLAICLGCLWTARSATARAVIQGNDCQVDSDEVINSDLFVLCRTFVLDGQINGNLLGATFEAELNGAVAGDVYLLAGQLDMRDQIGRDLLFAGPVLRVHPTAVFADSQSDLISLSLSTEVFVGATVPGSITSLSYQLLLGGDVGREVTFWGSALNIDGNVVGDVNATVGDQQSTNPSQLQTLLVPFRYEVSLVPPGLVIRDTAAIDGQLTYTGPTEGSIDGTFAAPVIFNQISNTPDFPPINLDDDSNAAWVTSYVTVVVREFVTLGGIGLLLLLLLPRPLQAPLQTLRARPLNSVGVGILTFILSIGVWVVILLLLVLLIVLFLSLRLTDLVIVSIMAIGVLNVGGAGVFYFTAIYISRIIVCLAVGRVVVRLALGDDGTPRMVYFNLAAGVLLLSMLVFLPLVGGIINALTLAFGLGAIFVTLTQIQTRETVNHQLLPVTLPGQVRQIPPPPITNLDAREPGMDNLPDGFEWWHED